MTNPWRAALGDLVHTIIRTTAAHPVAAPIVIGLASGASGSLMLVGAVAAGYFVGRAGVGARGIALALVACAFGTTAVFVGMIQSSLPQCPSCVDAYLVAPAAIPFFLIPLALGIWIGGRSRGRHAAVTSAQSQELSLPVE